MAKKRTPNDFKFLRTLGEGSFSSVYLAVDAKLDRQRIHELSQANHRVRKYAIKVCQKAYIKRQNKQVAIMREKEILNILNQTHCEHFIKLYCTFQDRERLYFVTDYADKGELLEYMQANVLSVSLVRRFTRQLLTALEQMHRLGIVHRDLKPENILLSKQLHIKISDFGSAKIYPELSNSELHDQERKHEQAQERECPKDPSSENVNPPQSQQRPRRYSFVGTAQYVSPEILLNQKPSNMSDMWAFGLIVYQMLTKEMLFNAPNEYLIYQKVQNLDFSIPEDLDKHAKDLVTSMIKLNPSARLGARDNLRDAGYTSIRQHPFLADDNDGSPVEHQNGATEHNNALDPDLLQVDDISPGLDESQLLRLLALG